MSSFFDKIIPTLLAVAPTLAGALGSPIAGMAVSTLEDALGLTPGSSSKDNGAQLTSAVLGMSPEVAAKMRQADQDFAAKMKQLDIDVEALAAKDRDSARNMQIQTRDITPRLLAGAVVVGFFSLLGLMAFQALPAANTVILNVMIGSLGAAVTAIVQFYFGSSAGSQAKDKTIQNMSTAS